MKKIILFAALALMLTPFAASALDLNGVAGVQMSNQVKGTYFSNTTASDATQYSLSTAHLQGNTIYATSSIDSKIYKKTLADGVTVNPDLSDLLTAHDVNIASDGTFAPM